LSRTEPESAGTASIRTIIVSGLSGSGKTTAIRALEDSGYYCVDNVPVALIDQVIQLCERGSITKVALVIDVREGQFLKEYEEAIGRLKHSGYVLETLFLWCRDDVLIRRFKETRRKHPLQEDQSIRHGIQREREALSGIRATATHIVDTSDLTVHSLRETIQETYQGTKVAPFQLRLLSFGFKYGLPLDADYVFDVRFLPNPYFNETLRPMTGMDSAVQQFLLEQVDTEPLLSKLEDMLKFVLPKAEREGKVHVIVGIGCTGGHHRSVMVVESLKERLETSYRIRIHHRDVERMSKTKLNQ